MRLYIKVLLIPYLEKFIVSYTFNTNTETIKSVKDINSNSRKLFIFLSAVIDEILTFYYILALIKYYIKQHLPLAQF